MRLHRVTTYRLLPLTAANHQHLHGLAGAGRFVWNALLADHKSAYEAWVEAGKPEGGKPPSPTFFTFGLQFTRMRQSDDPKLAWLRDYSMPVVRASSAKRLGEAYSRTFRNGAGFPKFKSKHRHAPSFDIPDAKLRDGRLMIPKWGGMVVRRRGGDPYADVGELRSATVTLVGGKWYAHLKWRMPKDWVGVSDNGKAVGLDFNQKNIAASTGEITCPPDTSRLEARAKRYQRKAARQVKGSNRRNVTLRRMAKARRAAAGRTNAWRHQITRDIANAAGTVVVEDLKVRNMTRRGGGRKRMLNRGNLAPGWSDLRAKLEYKAARVVAVDPRNTSRTCHECGLVSKDSRRTQARFACVGCGHESNADVNAALNICRRGLAELGVEWRGRGKAPTMKRQKIGMGWRPSVVNHSW